jgi:hypothetical protein
MPRPNKSIEAGKVSLLLRLDARDLKEANEEKLVKDGAVAGVVGDSAVAERLDVVLDPARRGGVGVYVHGPVEVVGEVRVVADVEEDVDAADDELVPGDVGRWFLRGMIRHCRVEEERVDEW